MRYKHPKKVEIVEALPRNPAGKVLKTELRAQFGAEEFVDSRESSTAPTISAGCQEVGDGASVADGFGSNPADAVRGGGDIGYSPVVCLTTNRWGDGAHRAGVQAGRERATGAAGALHQLCIRRGGLAVTSSANLSGYVRDQVRPGIEAVGGFVRICVLAAKALFRPPFQWREFILQSWFLMRVAFLPTVAVSIPLTVLLIFTLNILLTEFGAADISGAGAALAAVTQLGPLVTVLVVAGAGSTAICADLGARTIRQEIDALEVLGIDPIQRLVVPRVIASTFVALLLNGAVITIGLVGGFIFGVYLQNVSAGAYVSTLTLVTGLPEVLISLVKALTFGLIAGLVGCYRGLTVAGGAKGVGTAVNETLVLCVIALFAVNVVLTTIGVRFGTGS